MVEKDFKKVSIEKVTTIPDKNGFYELYKNRFWTVTEDNCILFYKDRAPQCNSNKSITESFTDYYKSIFPNCRTELIENVWLSHDCQDYI